MPLFWCLQSGMKHCLMVIVYVVLNSSIAFKTIIDGIKVNVIVLQRLPELFYSNIVQYPCLCHPSISRCPALQDIDPLSTSIVATLVTLYDLRFTKSGFSILQHILTPLGTHGVANPPPTILRLYISIIAVIEIRTLIVEQKYI